jgi:hypothetical protein
VPELCYLTGLTDEMKNDFRVMKNIAMYTRITPNQRQAALKKFVSNILGMRACVVAEDTVSERFCKQTLFTLCMRISFNLDYLWTDGELMGTVLLDFVALITFLSDC